MLSEPITINIKNIMHLIKLLSIDLNQNNDFNYTHCFNFNTNTEIIFTTIYRSRSVTVNGITAEIPLFYFLPHRYGLPHKYE